MVVVIGTGSGEIAGFLSSNGVNAGSLPSEKVPSLTALLLSRKDITDIVFPHKEERHWSMGHILAAAKQLQGAGRIYVLSPDKPPPALISYAAGASDLLRHLTRSSTSSAGASSGGRRPEAPPEANTLPKAAARDFSYSIRPLSIPSGQILFLGVIGSQRRIGCTTQAVGLWHYCKALGFDTAIVSGKEQIAQIAAPMRCKEISGGYTIEGIPFVTETTYPYDCYILDIGAGSIPDALRAADCLVLVAGVKPWEIPYTAAALRSAQNAELPVLLSFCSEADAAGLRPLFGSQNIAVVPWTPELWTPSQDALEVYDRLLRPVLQRILSMEETLQEEYQ